MNRAVADSTVLIYLAKLGRLRWLSERYDEVLVPDAVWHEVVQEGREAGAADAVAVDRAFEEGPLRRAEAPSDEALTGIGLEPADADVLAVALGDDVRDVLTDDLGIRRVARAMDLRPRGTLYFCLRAVDRGDLEYDTYLYTLEELLAAGFRMSPELFMRAVRLGRELAGG